MQELMAIRKGLKMSQAAVSAQVGISQQYYNYIESGKRRPSVAVAKKIADVLGFPWTRFFEDEQTSDSA